MRCDLSIIVPLYYEEDNVRLLHEAICAAVRPLGLRTEIVFVDDGSKDRTFERCLELPRTNPDLRLVKFRRNAGQTAAMAAGIDHARGDVLITMDGDLQNDPQDIPLFLEKIAEGYDLVVGWRHDRQDHWSRVLPSKVANWLIGKVTGVPIKDNGCSLKAYRADLIKNIPLYNEMHRFIPAMASLAAPRIAQIKVRHHPRRFGSRNMAFPASTRWRGSGDDPQHPLVQPPAGDVAGPRLRLRRAGCNALPGREPVAARDRAVAEFRGVHQHERAAGLAVDLQHVPGPAQPSDLWHHASRFRPFLMMSARAPEATAGPASSKA